MPVKKRQENTVKLVEFEQPGKVVTGDFFFIVHISDTFNSVRYPDYTITGFKVQYFSKKLLTNVYIGVILCISYIYTL